MSIRHKATKMIPSALSWLPLLLLMPYSAWVFRTAAAAQRDIRLFDRVRNAPSVNGSLSGIDTGGQLVLAASVAGGTPAVTFVLHQADLDKEVDAWNRVAAELERRPDRPLPLIGYCDQGAGCRDAAKIARFKIVSYADVRQMRALARADARGDFLLQDPSGYIIGQLPSPRGNSPAETADRIMRSEAN